MNGQAPRTILGILAGGRSRRFGSSKLDITIAGLPILQWQLRRLRLGVRGGVWLNLSPGQALPAGAGGFDRIVYDRSARRGPLGGIAAMLAAARSGDIVVVAPVDMPLIEPAQVLRLVAHLKAAGPSAAAVMWRWAGGEQRGRIEPLPAAWSGGADAPGTTLARQAMHAGVLGLNELVGRRSVTCLPIVASEQTCFVNVNRPKDLNRIAGVLGTTIN